MSLCGVDGCNRRALHRGWCNAHYARWWATGDLGNEPIRVYGRAGCQVPDCDRAHFCHGFCRPHYRHWKANGDPLVVGNAGSAHHLWAGTGVGYSGQHDRMRRALGPASAHTCRHCARRAREWAYDHTDPDERRDGPTGLLYSPDSARYMPLCKSCHKLFDNAHRLTAGKI